MTHRVAVVRSDTGDLNLQSRPSCGYSQGNVSKNSRNALRVHRQKQIKGHNTVQEEPDNGV